jgi:type VI secretion system protein ImpK
MTPSSAPTAQPENLALLYQGLLTSIVRVRSGAQPISDCDEFRKRIKDVLTGVEREAIRLGYREEDIRNTNYAVVAFLDEGILDSKDPNRDRWTALQTELYGQAVAGESFFDQLNGLRNRRDSPQVGDILEVYYLCLLLGYRGRYAGYASDRIAELRQIMDDLKERIETIRGRELPLSPGPPPGLPVQAAPSPPPAQGARTAKWIAVASLAGVIVLWILFKVMLSLHADTVRSALME